MRTRRESISSKAIEILKENPNGIRYSELIRKIKQEFPYIPTGTIHGTIWQLDSLKPGRVYKAARGLFRHTVFRDKEITEIKQKAPKGVAKTKEEDFYQPFADWLVNELEECTKAIPLGGNKFKDKWGTPDVIGKREPRRSDIIQAPTDIISAEIKINTKDLITAFGQACSYKLFSHESYIVIPKDASQEDIAKLDSLCLICGIGLILFDSSVIDNPQFEIRVRPIKREPDMFYTNKYIKMIEKELFP